MAKRKKTIIAGRLRKTVIYTAPEPRDNPRTRAAKSRATSAAQKAMNDRTARGRLELLFACNFTGKDLFLTLTYRDGDLPATRKEAVRNARRFLAELRKARRLRGSRLKYIHYRGQTREQAFPSPYHAYSHRPRHRRNTQSVAVW